MEEKQELRKLRKWLFVELAIWLPLFILHIVTLNISAMLLVIVIWLLLYRNYQSNVFRIKYRYLLKELLEASEELRTEAESLADAVNKDIKLRKKTA